jgi:hypothetical protein
LKKYITVEELMNQLQNYSKTSIVVLATDSRGTEFKPFSYSENYHFYDEENDTVYPGEDAEPMKNNLIDCIVLWP